MNSSFSPNNKNNNNGGTKSGKTTSTFSCRNLSLRLRRSMFQKLGRRLSEVTISTANRNNESLLQQEIQQIHQNLSKSKQKNHSNHEKNNDLKSLSNFCLIENNNDNKGFISVTPTNHNQNNLINKYYSNDEQNATISNEKTLSSNKSIKKYNNDQESELYKFRNCFNDKTDLLFDKNSNRNICNNANDNIDDKNKFSNTSFFQNKTLIFEIFLKIFYTQIQGCSHLNYIIIFYFIKLFL